MFTQRPPFQPPTRKSNSPSPESNVKGGESQTDPSLTSSYDGRNKQMEFVDAGMAVCKNIFSSLKIGRAFMVITQL